MKLFFFLSPLYYVTSIFIQQFFVLFWSFGLVFGGFLLGLFCLVLVGSFCTIEEHNSNLPRFLALLKINLADARLALELSCIFHIFSSLHDIKMLLILCTTASYLDNDDIKKSRGKGKMPKRHSVVFS